MIDVAYLHKIPIITFWINQSAIKNETICWTSCERQAAPPQPRRLLVHLMSLVSFTLVSHSSDNDSTKTRKTILTLFFDIRSRKVETKSSQSWRSVLPSEHMVRFLFVYLSHLLHCNDSANQATDIQSKLAGWENVRARCNNCMFRQTLFTIVLGLFWWLLAFLAGGNWDAHCETRWWVQSCHLQDDSLTPLDRPFFTICFIVSLINIRSALDPQTYTCCSLQSHYRHTSTRSVFYLSLRSNDLRPS